jgi:PhnB protein
MRLRTYLNYGGNCAEAFKFYEKHLGGKILTMMTHEQSPESSGIKPEWKNAILYAQIAIGDTEVMASDVSPERFQPMRSVYLSLSVESDAEAERIYKLLTEEGEVFMPIQQTFFASRFGQIRDRFGTSWMVIHERSMQG